MFIMFLLAVLSGFFGGLGAQVVGDRIHDARQHEEVDTPAKDPNNKPKDANSPDACTPNICPIHKSTENSKEP